MRLTASHLIPRLNMSEESKNPKIDRFNECRKTFVASLNSVCVLSSLAFLTTFLPYTTYVGNLLAQKCKDMELTEQEQGANFNLIDLEKQWLEKHEPSVDPSKILYEETNITNSLGNFSFSKPELVLIYPGVISVLIIYLYFHMFNLYELKNKLHEEDSDVTQIPTNRIRLSWFLIYMCLFASTYILVIPAHKFPFRQKEVIVQKTFRLGEIVVQESAFQLDRNIDLYIIIFSLIVSLASPAFFFYLASKKIDVPQKK